MAGVINNTARQFNLKCITRGKRYVIRLSPMLNDVDDEHWKAFVPKDRKKIDPYVKHLMDENQIEFGSKVDAMLLNNKPETVSKSKAEPIVEPHYTIIEKPLSDDIIL